MKFNKIIISRFIILLLWLILAGCGKTDIQVIEEGVTIQPFDLIEISYSKEMDRFAGARLFHHHAEIYQYLPESGSYELVSQENVSSENSSPDWHPTKNQILYISPYDFRESKQLENNIGYINLDTDEVVSVGFGTAATWYPDGSKIIFSENDGKILQYSIGDQTLKEIMQFDLGVGDYISQISVSPSLEYLSLILKRSELSALSDEVIICEIDEDLSIVDKFTFYTGKIGYFADIAWLDKSNRFFFLNNDELRSFALNNDCPTNDLIIGKDFKLSYFSSVDVLPEYGLAIQGINEQSEGVLAIIEFQSTLYQNWINSNSCNNNL